MHLVAPVRAALISCAFLGFRHGFDYDHIAAITDIASVQRRWTEGMRLGFLYALGHACTVAVLGVAAISFGRSIPARLDVISEKAVGITLLLLTAYTVFVFARKKPHNHDRPVSRIAAMVSLFQYMAWKLRKVRQKDLERPPSFRFRYEADSAFGIGVLHGLGAETPTQLVIFLLAAKLGGMTLGLLGLLCFIGGLLVMNSLMTASASGIFSGAVRRPLLQSIAVGCTAIYSFAIGIIFVSGVSDRMPQLLR